MLIPHQKLTIKPKHIIKGAFNYLTNQKLKLKIRKFVPHKHLYWTSSARYTIQQILKPHFRVGISAFTCNVLPQAIKLANCTPVYYDSGINTDIKEIKKIIDQIDILIIPENFGFIPDMEKIRKLCKQHAVQLIEDCAASLGATYNQQPSGSFADTTAYSFNMSKGFFIGGLLASNYKQNIKQQKAYPTIELLLHTLKGLSAQFWFSNIFYGITEKLVHTQLKTKYPSLQHGMSRYAKYVIAEQLKDFKKVLKRRKKNAHILIQNLTGIIDFEKPIENSEPSWQYFVFLVKNKHELQVYLRKQGIDLIPSKTFYNLTNDSNYKLAKKAENEQLIFALDRPKKEVYKLIKEIKKWNSLN